ncbi:MAG TPA: type II secretion system F family protein [Blastocatellia bacterium]|nr:type II secretion system F family protein [Blastocatellia bacterium]
MDWLLILFQLSVLFSVMSVVAALYWWLVRPANPVNARLKEINPTVIQTPESPQVTRVLVERVAKPISRLTPAPSPRNVRRLRKRLIMAGFFNENTVSVYRALQLAAAVIFPGLTAFVLLVAGRGLEFSGVALVLIAVAFGLFIPSFMLSRRITRQQQKITHALPDALDLMVVCVEAGLGLNAALYRVGQEMELVEPALSTQLGVTNREIRAGKPREEALRNLGDRTGVDDLKSLVAMLIQTDRFGTSIADSLRVFADSLRTRRRQRAEEMVAKTTIKLIFPLLLFIFPALLIVLLVPALIKMSAIFVQGGP